jgi:hypothetical protein
MPWCQHNYLCTRTYFGEIGLNGNQVLAQSRFSAHYPGDWLIATVDLRLHRSMFLAKLQDISMEIASGSLLDIHNRKHDIENSMSMMRYSSLRALWPSFSDIIAYQMKMQVNLAVLHAELTGEPWPVDPFDAKGGPVRQLIQDGQCIGVYSIGKNQIDDHGDKQKDIVVKLRPRPATVDAKPSGGR